MADKKLPDQEWFNKQVGPQTGTGTSALVGMADAATIGYLPKLVAWGTGMPEEAAYKIIEAAKQENPRSTMVGQGVGYLAPAGAALKGGQLVWRGAQAAKQYAWPALKAGLGLGAAAGTGAAIANVAGPSEPEFVKAEREAAQPQPEAQPAAAAAPAAERAPRWDEQWAAKLGVTTDDIRGMVKQSGGIPLFAAEKLSGMRGKAPGYKDVAFDYVMQDLNGRAAAAQQSGNVEEMQRVRQDAARAMLSIMGADPIGTMLSSQMEE